MSDPDVEALRKLCGSTVEGRQRVADTIGSSEQAIYQILSGVKLPSGNPRGVGPKLRQRLDAAFPGWRGQPISLAGQVQAGARATADLSVGRPPELEQALPVVLDAIARCPARDKLRTAVLALLEDDAPAYRQRLAELLSPAAGSELDQAA